MHELKTSLLLSNTSHSLSTCCKVYLIEVENFDKGKKQKGPSLAEYAFRNFVLLGLAESVKSIDEGRVGMTSAQHKARGVLYVTQVSSMMWILFHHVVLLNVHPALL